MKGTKQIAWGKVLSAILAVLTVILFYFGLAFWFLYLPGR
jgi:hypothetical protein